jgi:hypothetical protein
MVILLAACGGTSEKHTLAQNPGITQTAPTPQVEVIATSQFPIDLPKGPRLLLNEVLFAPEKGHFAFIELKNAGLGDVELADVVLENERGETIKLPSSSPTLNSGEVFLISMDSSIENSVQGFAAGLTSFLSAENGTLFLFDPDGSLLDQVDWGVDNPNSVRLSRGGVPPLQFPLGMSVGRSPLSFSRDRLEWTTFSQQQVTPGEPNPSPGVEILIPSDGAFFEQFEIPLAWYVVPGAVNYRVQVSTDTVFDSIEIDAVVVAPPVSTDPLPPGDYFWRVQAIGADGGLAKFSPIHKFIIEVAESAAVMVPISYNPGSVSPSQDQQRKVLPVVQIFQKKDSNMLLLESPRSEGAHAWNVSHPGYSGDDPADNSNCALASIVMLNHFYGGDLTQDRIGWEVFKDRTSGPELDLNWGSGLNISQIEHGLAVALPGSLLYYLETDELRDDFFDQVVKYIDAGQPVLAVYPGHATVITGYRIHGDNRYYHLNDPTIGKYWRNAEKKDWTFYFMPGNEGETDDPTHYLDFDNDGINNFDEMYRFNTDPNNPDTDRDGLRDGLDVYASVHDESFGYSGDMNMRGRDFDDDGLPMELDFDADDGGCMDSLEDTNLNGKYDSSEDTSWNFADWDDQCWKLTMDWLFTDEWGNTSIEFRGNFIVGDEMEIEGLGNVYLAHYGPCVDAIQFFGFKIGGVFENDILKLEIQDIPGGPNPDLSEELRCTIGETMGEAYAVSFGSGWAMQEVIEIPAKENTTIEIETHSPVSVRVGDLFVTVEKIEVDYSK